MEFITFTVSRTMDPISIIGLAGSIVGIVDVVTKSLKALNELLVKSRLDTYATHNVTRYCKSRTYPDRKMDKFKSRGRPT